MASDLRSMEMANAVSVLLLLLGIGGSRMEGRLGAINSPCTLPPAQTCLEFPVFLNFYRGNQLLPLLAYP